MDVDEISVWFSVEFRFYPSTLDCGLGIMYSQHPQYKGPCGFLDVFSIIKVTILCS